MQDVKAIIEALGGDTVVSKELPAPLATVNTWKRKNYVPAWRISGLLAMALKKQVALSTNDFPAPKPRKPSAKAEMQAAA